MPALAEHFTVIAPDQRGAGGSSKPRGTSYAKRQLAQDIRALVTTLVEDEPLNLVGYDWGANTAWAYAAAWPEQVRRVALLEMIFPGFGYEQAMTPQPGWDQVWQLAAFIVPDVCERFFVGRERELLTWYFWRGSDNPNAISMADLEIYVRTLQLPNALRTGPEYFAAVWEDTEHNREIAQRKIPMPVLAAGGARAIGHGVTQAAVQFADHMTPVVIEDAGHWLTDERPTELTQELLEFFAPDHTRGDLRAGPT